MAFYVYIIQSGLNGAFYSGSSHDPVLRCQRHNEGWTKSTKGKGPWKLVYVRKFDTKAEALAFEQHIKKMKSGVFNESLFLPFRVCPIPTCWQLRTS